MVKRLNEEQFIERVNLLWQQFHDRPELQGITFDDFKKECFEEFRKQQRMSDKNLKDYREKAYNSIINEVDKLTTKEEKKKLNEEDNKTVIVDETRPKNQF